MFFQNKPCLHRVECERGDSWRGPVSLQIEDKTPFGQLYKPGEAPLPEDSDAAEMYRLASHLLCAAGYEHYEVSSYALPGHRLATTIFTAFY